MICVIPINGSNERMGMLFNTPKHMLLVNGIPAISSVISIIKIKFPESKIYIPTNEDYINGIRAETGNFDGVHVVDIGKTRSQVETITKLLKALPCNYDEPLLLIDCDVIPYSISINPYKNGVFLFENDNCLTNYSNFNVDDELIIECNEKERLFKHAGAGAYYFVSSFDFLNYSTNIQSVSVVIRKMIYNGNKFEKLDGSKFFRFGTLNDIIS